MRFNQEQLQKIGKEISNKVEGKTLFDEFSRGRYSTDASVYQIKPLGVVLPKDTNDVLNMNLNDPIQHQAGPIHIFLQR